MRSPSESPQHDGSRAFALPPEALRDEPIPQHLRHLVGVRSIVTMWLPPRMPRAGRSTSSTLPPAWRMASAKRRASLPMVPQRGAASTKSP